MSSSKSEKLDSILIDLKSFVIAFSGGVDSSFLLYRAYLLNILNFMAITIKTPYVPSREIEEASEFTKSLGINHKVLNLGFPEILRNNQLERCYLCKKILFSEIVSYGKENNFKYIIDGTNADDTDDYRPGLKALNELGIKSPLLEAGLTKADIRDLSKKAGLNIWDKPAMACLLTRIPYNTEVKPEMLKMAEEAETMLFEKGYPGTRVRIHGNMARIECLPGYLEKIIHNPEREHIIANLKKIGFRYISLDLEGYRSGSSDNENRKI
jgi:pyridinium-3,5-biscarboxylic acid mononucleotide sulfurtransferase